MRVAAVAVAALSLALAPAAFACAPRASQASLESKLVCIQCHTTLDESSSPFANELKVEVARRIALCQTESQILDAMVAEFGPEVLSTPQTHGFDLLAWVLPLGGIALGAVGIGFGARQWAKARTDPADDSTQSGAALDASDEQRVDDELARFE